MATETPASARPVDDAATPSRDGDGTRRWGVGSVVAGVTVLVVALLVGGGLFVERIPGLPDAGTATRLLLPGARLTMDLGAVASVGWLVAAAFLLPARGADLGRDGLLALRSASVALLVWAAGALVGAAATLSEIAGLPLGRALAPAVVRAYAWSFPQIRALLVVALAALVLAAACRLVLGVSGAAWLLVLALATLLPPVFTGHSATAGDHELAVTSLAVHLLAVTPWVGGLVALGVVAARRGPLTAALPRYSRLAGWCLAATALTGVANAAVRLGRLDALVSTRYGALVCAKALAVAVLGWLGLRQRRRVLPQLGTSGGPAAFRRAAAVEVVVMVATVGLAVGLSRAPTPAVPPSPASLTPARLLLGYPLPPQATPARLLLDWHVDWFFLPLAVGLAVLYLVGLRRVKRAGVAWPAGRTASFLAGSAVIALATSSGLGRYGGVLFSAHMAEHMLLTMLAPLLLVLGAPITLALRALRVADDERRGPREWLLVVLHSRVATVLTNPVVALVLFITSVYGIYFTGLYELALRNHVAHVAMHLHFIGVGLLFFWPLIGVDPTPRRVPHVLRVVVLLASMPFHAFFAIALMSTSSVIAPSYYAALGRTWGQSALADQHLGGGIAWSSGELPAVLVLAAIFVQWVRADERDARRSDRRSDRAVARGDGSDELSEYNAYLASLQRRTERS